MIIVAGWLRVSPEDRTPYLANCREVIAAARAADGCIDFHLSADALDDGRINIFEQWASELAAEAFRGSGPSDDLQAMIVGAHVAQHEIVATISLT